MKKLFHGSNVIIEKIDLTFSKPNKDFGAGFYLSDNFEQAMEMAQFKSEIFGGKPTVMEYDFDENRAFSKEENLRILTFSDYSKEWAEFVFKNRTNESETNKYDIVIGPIANDKVGAQIRRFMEKDIDFETFLKRIKYMKGLTFQYFFGTERAISMLSLTGVL